MLPWGNLRDLPSQMLRANMVVVTKTPADITPIDKRIAVKSLKLFPYQSVFFTAMRQCLPVPVFPDAEGLVAPARNAVLLAGIGFDDKDHDEDGPGIELVDMADLKDEEAEAVKTMADLLVAAGMMHPDQDICIAKVGVPADGRPYASLYIGDDTILTVTPG